MSVDELSDVGLDGLVYGALAPLIHQYSLLELVILCSEAVDLFVCLQILGGG